MKRLSIKTDGGRVLNVKACRSYLFGKQTGWEFSFYTAHISNEYLLTWSVSRDEINEIEIRTIREFNERLQTVAHAIANDLERRGLLDDIRPSKCV